MKLGALPGARCRLGATYTAVLVGATLCALASGTTVAAQVFPGDKSPVRPVRIEGYWNRTTSERDVIGETVLTVDGRDRRTFGVTAIQAFKPAEEGMAVLRHSSLQPALLVRGTDELVARLWDAKPSQKATIMGTYTAGSGTLVLSSVDVKD